MKFLSVLFTLLIFAQFSFAQFTTKVDQIEASEVPSHVSGFIDSTFYVHDNLKWEKHTFTGKKNSWFKYVAVFNNAEGVNTRARFNQKGNPTSATTYYWFKAVEKLPQAIKDHIAKTYPGHKLISAEKEMLMRSGKSAYRVKAKKGTTKVVVWLDENGQEPGNKKEFEQAVSDEKVNPTN